MPKNNSYCPYLLEVSGYFYVYVSIEENGEEGKGIFDLNIFFDFRVKQIFSFHIFSSILLNPNML